LKEKRDAEARLREHQVKDNKGLHDSLSTSRSTYSEDSTAERTTNRSNKSTARSSPKKEAFKPTSKIPQLFDSNIYKKYEPIQLASKKEGNIIEEHILQKLEELNTGLVRKATEIEIIQNIQPEMELSDTSRLMHKLELSDRKVHDFSKKYTIMDLASKEMDINSKKKEIKKMEIKKTKGNQKKISDFFNNYTNKTPKLFDSKIYEEYKTQRDMSKRRKDCDLKKNGEYIE
jgi:hypothetical protein